MDSPGDQKWESYSVFKEISSELHKNVNNAIKAYAHINSLDTSNMGITPQTAVKVKRAILGVSTRVFYEIQINRHVDEYRDIYERWSGNKVDESGDIIEKDSRGYILLLEQADFTQGPPDFLSQLMKDLVKATWTLGYIRAGVYKNADPDKPDAQVSDMFE